MLIAIIILAWLLVNTWLSLIFAEMRGTFFSGWDDLAWLVIYAICNPFVALLVGKIIYKIRKIIRKKS